MNASEIANYYSALLKQHGPTHRAGDHGSEESQRARFRVLEEVVLLLGEGDETLLDVGCGIGEFETHCHIGYEGWDISPDLIEQAKKGRGDYATFRVRDIYASTDIMTHDYVVASGLFQFSHDHQMANGIMRMYALCRKGIAFNFLTRSDGTPGETSHNPIQVLRYCHAITPKIILRTDYLPNDATVMMYR